MKQKCSIESTESYSHYKVIIIINISALNNMEYSESKLQDSKEKVNKNTLLAVDLFNHSVHFRPSGQRIDTEDLYNTIFKV